MTSLLGNALPAMLALVQEAPSVGEIPTMSMGQILMLAAICFGVMAFFIAVSWKVFEKAGQPGWASLVPIYNLVVMFRIAGKPAWWIALMFVPIANIVAIFYVMFALPVALAHRFGRSTAFGIGLALLGPIFYPILAFGDSRYTPPPPSGAPAPAVA